MINWHLGHKGIRILMMKSHLELALALLPPHGTEALPGMHWVCLDLVCLSLSSFGISSSQSLTNFIIL